MFGLHTLKNCMHLNQNVIIVIVCLANLVGHVTLRDLTR